jgi:hypothetical protein
VDKFDVFEAAFQDEICKLAVKKELAKEAGFADMMFTLGKAVGKAKSVAAPLIEQAGKAYSGSAVGKYMAQSPRLSKAVGWTGNMIAGGAGFTLAQKAMAPSKKEVHILPQDSQQGVMPQFANQSALQRYGV